MISLNQFNQLRDLFIETKIINLNAKGSFKSKVCSNRYRIDKKIYQRCLEDFQSEDEFWYSIVNNIYPFTDEFLCPSCKQNRKKFRHACRRNHKSGWGYNTVCSQCTDKHNYVKLKTEEEQEAITEKRKATCREIFGVDSNMQLESFKEQAKQTKQERYGDPNYNNREQAKQTCLERYDTEWYIQTDEFKEQSRQTQIEHFGSIENAYQVRKVNSMHTKQERYGDENYHNIDQFKDTIEQRKKLFSQEHNATHVQELIILYGQGWKSLNLPYIYDGRNAYIENKYLDQIIQYASVNHTSSISDNEREVYSFIREYYNEEIHLNTRKIIRSQNDNVAELDIYIPNKKLAIEFNGSYWHSLNSGTDKNFHLHKTEECDSKGIRLIHIFEDYWKDPIKNEIYKSILLSSFNMYYQILDSKDCVCKEVNEEDGNVFLSNNDIRGSIDNISNFKKYGLYYNDKLVQLVIFNNNELLRNCTLLFTYIDKGLDKLIKFSNMKEFNFYIDRSLFTINEYINIGFKQVDITQPSYFVHRRGKRIEQFDKTLSVEELMNQGYFVLYDCGTIKLSYRKE